MYTRTLSERYAVVNEVNTTYTENRGKQENNYIKKYAKLSIEFVTQYLIKGPYRLLYNYSSNIFIQLVAYNIRQFFLFIYCELFYGIFWQMLHAYIREMSCLANRRIKKKDLLIFSLTNLRGVTNGCLSVVLGSVVQHL